MSIAQLSNAIIADLKIIPTNCVTNNDIVSDGENTYSSIRGFIGVPSITSNDLLIGVTWGKSSTLNSVVVKVTIASPTTVAIAYLEQPRGMASARVNALIEDFLNLMNPKVQVKKRNFQNKKKGGGKYVGRRLEARNRNKVPPTCHFSSAANILFTQTFINTAQPLTIIYK